MLQSKQVIAKWVSAYNNHNIQEITALYAENITNIQIPYDKPVQGRDMMRQVFARTFQAFPDIHLEAENLIDNGAWVVLEWRFNGTMKGEFVGKPATGKSFNLRGCEIFQVLDGKIEVQHGYWDKVTMFSQLGII